MQLASHSDLAPQGTFSCFPSADLIWPMIIPSLRATLANQSKSPKVLNVSPLDLPAAAHVHGTRAIGLLLLEQRW